MERISKFLLLAIFLLASLNIQAQSVTVTGKVTDSDGMEVIGANVLLKGSAGVGTITDLDGKYTIKVNNAAKDVLVFSYVGMQNQEVKVAGKTQINVTLKADAIQLDEVVAIGYGTSRRKDLTGSVVSVKSEDLLKTPTSDVTQALAGRVAGVQVMQSEGAPGLKYQSAYVEVYQSPKVMNLFILLTDSQPKMVYRHLIRVKSKALIF